MREKEEEKIDKKIVYTCKYSFCIMQLNQQKNYVFPRDNYSKPSYLNYIF